MKDVIIIGGGASGMAAAVFASEAGANVKLYEKNEKLGKKVYITGKGRCNFTNECTPPEFLENVITNKKFLFSSIYSFDSYAAIDLFKRLGMKTKVERGRRVFPLSDHASDVIKVLKNRMDELGVEIFLNHKIDKLPLPDDNTAVIIATGGLSYPSTGSDGDGYRFAKETGHSITSLRPALVRLLTKDTFIARLEGLSLKNVSLKITNKDKKVFEDFGEMLFTNDGISGPMSISASSVVGKLLETTNLTGHIDLKPALSEEQLDMRLLREFDDKKNKFLKNVIGSLVPSKMIPVIIEKSGISGEKSINSVTKEDRKQLILALKDFTFTIVKTGSFLEAVITQGGVDVKDINPKTMESKLVKGLYFIGEILDVDALTGGYNLQIAWSTAYAAVSGIKNSK